MLGLVMKDLLNMKGQYKIMLFMVLIYGGLAYSSKNTELLGLILAMFSIMTPITAVSFDEKSKWDAYAMTMPVSRGSLATSKYLLALMSLVVMMMVYFVFTAVAFELPVESLVVVTLGFTGLAMVAQALMIPIVVHFGVEKGRILMILAFMLPMGAVYAFQKLGLNEFVGTPGLGHYVALGVCVVGLWLGSLRVSRALYEGKEY